MTTRMITLKTVDSPEKQLNVPPVLLSDETIRERLNKVLAGMQREGFDALVIYADKEHGGNFEYLTGFIPRFEEAVLVLEDSGAATAILGNENMKMANFSRIPVTAAHCPFFSLPNQPMDNERPLADIFSAAGLGSKHKIGLVGWKMFTPTASSGKRYFDLPWFIVDAIQQSTAGATLENAAHLFIGGADGARVTNNENEIAHYEYGANLSSNCILDAMDAVEPGVMECQLGARLSAEGQYHSVVTIAATGQRFEKANLYPTTKKVQRGDPLSLTVGFKGGLSSRCGFVIADRSELPQGQQDYLERIAGPYFGAVVAWLENIHVGMPGGQLYDTIEQVFPKARYGWHLNPGHLVADEEWMSSPVYNGSVETLKSGMILQIDIIPSVAGYTGASAEECVALADGALRQKISQHYPQLWQRITARRQYLRQTLNIQLSDDVLPLSNSVAYLRPFYLAKHQAFAVA
ncbi:M24 family metallopeptidase [Entomohabitans teleogrylli]|uniref:M24 family metallopeptidase n=1 Tax=Entomohabitans teleogrylli TaxID=1384589 RepID=UPI00073D234B|nr:aminopeptidase P family protein [Entomohabitans teleogrylli]